MHRFDLWVAHLETCSHAGDTAPSHMRLWDLWVTWQLFLIFLSNPMLFPITVQVNSHSHQHCANIFFLETLVSTLFPPLLLLLLLWVVQSFLYLWVTLCQLSNIYKYFLLLCFLFLDPFSFAVKNVCSPVKSCVSLFTFVPFLLKSCSWEHLCPFQSSQVTSDELTVECLTFNFSHLQVDLSLVSLSMLIPSVPSTVYWKDFCNMCSNSLFKISHLKM